MKWANLRDAAALLLMLALTYRLAVSKITIDLSGFSFTDLLSLVLAVSAVVLSAAFYFKADESSKNFYDNTYNFTRHISETLGRIEERFGERLKNIDEGYSGISRRLDGIPLELKSAAEGEQREKQAVSEIEDKIKKALEDLLAQTQIPDTEKEDLKKQLVEMTEDLYASKAELARFKDSRIQAEELLGMSDRLFLWLKDFIEKNLLPSDLLLPPEKFVRRFNRLFDPHAVEASVIDELRDRGFISERNGMTLEGALFFRAFAKNVLSARASSVAAQRRLHGV
jgi:hypothetical protein